MRRVHHLVLAAALVATACAAAPVRSSAAPDVAPTSPRGEPDRYASSKAIAHYLRARLAELQGDHRVAVDELKLAIVYDEASAHLRVSLGEVLARLAQLEAAELQAQRALELEPGGPSTARAYELLAKVHLAQHRRDAAADELRQAIRAELTAARDRVSAGELPAIDPAPWKLLAEVQLEAGDEQGAASTLEQLAAHVPGEGSGFREMGRAFLERHDYGSAERYLKRAAEVDHGDAEALRRLAQVHEATRRYGEAQKDLEALLRLDGDDLDALLSLGSLAARAGDFPGARAYFDQALRLSPDEAATRVNVAFVWLEVRRPTEALAVVDEGVRAGLSDARLHLAAGLVLQDGRRWSEAAHAFEKIRPGDGDLYGSARVNLAYCLSQAGRHDDAMRALERAIAERPRDERLLTMHAFVLERAGRVREAIALLEREVKQHERGGARQASPELYDALASSLEKAGRYREAVALLRRALESRPRDEALLYALGTAYDKSGDGEAAVGQMKAILALDPDHADALNFIGYSYAERGVRLDEAERLIARALELKPDNGFFLDSLGWVYFKKGDYARAVGTLERADQVSGPEATILEHLGDAYRSAQRPVDAAAAYRRALKTVVPAAGADESAARASLEKKLKELSAL